jgi:hypothetical protein
MARDSESRTAAWQAKFNVGRVAETLYDRRQGMSERVRVAFEGSCRMEEEVRVVLNESSVPTILFVRYLDFGRQLCRFVRRQNVSGPALQFEAGLLRDK